MPGYWNRDDARERQAGQQRQERRQGAPDTRGGDDRQGGGGNAQAEQRRRAAAAKAQANLDKASREGAERLRQQKITDDRNKAAAAEKARISATQSFPRDRNIGGKGPLSVLENLGSSNLEKMMSMHDPAGLSYNFLNMLDNAYLNKGKYDPYARSERTGQLIYQNAEIGEPGAMLVNGEWKKPILTGLGSYLHEQATTGTYDDQGRFTMDRPYPTSSSDMFTGIPTTLLPQNIPAVTSQLDKALSYIGGGGGGGGGWGGYGGYGGYGGGYGGGGGGGYYGPQPGYKPEQMAGFYTPQANLQQAMVNVHGTPTVFKKRGGIVSLLRL